MKRQVIKIDKEKCNGCGLCAKACHEGAIDIVNGKAVLARENFCDGFGDCLPNCPQRAISFEERDVPAYDEETVNRAKKAKVITIQSIKPIKQKTMNDSLLANWPVQIKLAPVNAQYYDHADLLICASCSAYAYASFHEDFINGKVTLIGCTKLDGIDYSDKLSIIFKENNIHGITIVKMEVPCCRGLEIACRNALIKSNKAIPIHVITISIDGEILE